MVEPYRLLIHHRPSRQARDRRKPARNLSSSYRVIAMSIPALPNESGAVRDAVREDCVGGSQFEPYHLHHPVSANHSFPSRRQIGRFCGDFRPLTSRTLFSAGVRPFRDDFWRPVSASKNPVPNSQGFEREVGPHCTQFRLLGRCNWDLGPARQLFWIEAECVELPAPFSRRVAEPFDTNAAG